MQLPQSLQTVPSTTAFLQALQMPETIQWISTFAQQNPHIRWPRDSSSSPSPARANRIASVSIAAARNDSDIEDAIAEVTPPVELSTTWHHEIAPEWHDAIADLNPSIDRDEITDAFRETWEDHARSCDDSTPSDLFFPADTCELLFLLTRQPSFEDSLIHSQKPWADPAFLTIDQNLQFALNQIGYTATDFRKKFNNRTPAIERLSPRPPARPPIVSLEQLRETIDNACSRQFIFALYAIVPVTDAIALDPNLPITFDRSWLATLDPINGTFHEVPTNSPLTISPDSGQLITGADLPWSPDEICGLYRPHYHARVRNNATV